MSEFLFDNRGACGEHFDERELLRHLTSMLEQMLTESDDFPAAGDIYRATKALGDYCAANQIESIVLPDRSARSIRVGLDEYLQLAHPEFRRPSFHFLNPDAFIQKKSRYSEPGLSYVAADEQMRDSHNALLTMDRKQPLLIFDTCMHTGESIGALRGYLADHLGFQNVRTGVFTEETRGFDCSEKLDFRYTTDGDILACYPYGDADNTYMTKSRSDIYARPTRDEGDGEEIAEDRAYYRELIRVEHQRAMNPTRLRLSDSRLIG